jgi:hypothetical protein
MFASQPLRNLRIIVFLKRVFLPLLLAYLCITLIAGYRAWYQVRTLDLQTSDAMLRPGTTIVTKLVSYARTTIDVRVELVQGGHAEIVSSQQVRGNDWAFFDPRNRQASNTAVITDGLLSRFTPGKAQLRATAVGRHQWMRLPPPVVRELVVEIPPVR